MILKRNFWLLGDPDVDFEETVYLNLIIHQFEYVLTLAICTRTSPKELQVLKSKSKSNPSKSKVQSAEFLKKRKFRNFTNKKSFFNSDRKFTKSLCIAIEKENGYERRK